MLRWRKNLPLRKGGLIADSSSGVRYWIHRHEKFSVTFWSLSYRLPGEEVANFRSGHWFARQKYAKEMANEIERFAT